MAETALQTEVTPQVDNFRATVESIVDKLKEQGERSVNIKELGILLMGPVDSITRKFSLGYGEDGKTIKFSGNIEYDSPVIHGSYKGELKVKERSESDADLLGIGFKGEVDSSSTKEAIDSLWLGNIAQEVRNIAAERGMDSPFRFIWSRNGLRLKLIQNKG